MATNNKKFYFSNFIEKLSVEELRDIFYNFLINEGLGIVSEDMEELKEDILTVHMDRSFEEGEMKKYYPIYEISVREIGYCTAITKCVVEGEIITTY